MSSYIKYQLEHFFVYVDFVLLWGELSTQFCEFRSTRTNLLTFHTILNMFTKNKTYEIM